jgi:N-methylhydantoinase B
MNNLLIGGIDQHGKAFAYYETIGGGGGARPDQDGLSGRQVHMTNTLNTPIEALEMAYPLRITEYALRRGSGGAGKFRGGDGLIREIEALVPCEVTLLAERRETRPYGLAGGEDGQAGEDWVIRADGSRERLSGHGTVRLEPGDRVRIATPGGGGWGREQ